MQSGGATFGSPNTDVGWNWNDQRLVANSHTFAYRNVVRASRGNAADAANQSGADGAAPASDRPTDVCAARADIHVAPIFYSYPLPYRHPDEHAACI